MFNIIIGYFFSLNIKKSEILFWWKISRDRNFVFAINVIFTSFIMCHITKNSYQSIIHPPLPPSPTTTISCDISIVDTWKGDILIQIASALSTQKNILTTLSPLYGQLPIGYWYHQEPVLRVRFSNSRAELHHFYGQRLWENILMRIRLRIGSIKPNF
jgi:hypothetical protein